MMVFDAVPIAVIGRPKDAGIGWPANLSRAGLGSKVSRWLGPPSINSQMTDVACGWWCGFFGASGSGSLSSAPNASSASSDASTMAPKPPLACIKKSRRIVSALLSGESSPCSCFRIPALLVDVNEFIRVKEDVAEVHQRRSLSWLDPRWQVRRQRRRLLLCKPGFDDCRLFLEEGAGRLALGRFRLTSEREPVGRSDL